MNSCSNNCLAVGRSFGFFWRHELMNYFATDDTLGSLEKYTYCSIWIDKFLLFLSCREDYEFRKEYYRIITHKLECQYSRYLFCYRMALYSRFQERYTKVCHKKCLWVGANELPIQNHRSWSFLNEGECFLAWDPCEVYHCDAYTQFLGRLPLYILSQSFRGIDQLPLNFGINFDPSKAIAPNKQPLRRQRSGTVEQYEHV